MRDRSGFVPQLARFAAARIGVAGLASMMAAVTCWSQAPSPPAPGAAPNTPPQASPGPPAPPPAREENPGLINEMGKVLERSLSILPTLKSPSETIDDLNSRAKDAAKDAGEGLSRLTGPSSMVTGRLKCPLSATGVADCKVAADQLCRSKGYKAGKSLTTDAAEACSPKVLIPGRARKPDDCRTDNYVTRALCQ